MEKQNKKELKQVVETKVELILLRLQASKIRNSQNLQESIDALINFVGCNKRLSYTN